jgi:hypothetical protein
VLLACADDTRRIRERRERNNCRSARRRIRIVPAGVPTPPVAPFILPGTGFRAPSIGVTGPPNGTLTSDTTPNYSGTAQSFGAAVARIEAKLDTGPFSSAGVNCSGCGTPTASWTFSPPALADGPHSLSFRAIDTAGRSSPVLTRTLTVDATAPTFTSITATPMSAFVTATFSEPLACLTVNPSDFSAEIGGSLVAVDSVSCTAPGATITLTLASAPPANALVRVTLQHIVSDQAGNIVPWPTIQSDSA